MTPNGFDSDILCDNTDINKHSQSCPMSLWHYSQFFAYRYAYRRFPFRHDHELMLKLKYHCRSKVGFNLYILLNI